jgi:RHS repeat-associated protein
MNRLIKETNFVDKNNNQIFDAGEGVSQFEYALDAQGRKLSAIEKFWADLGNDGVIEELFNNITWKYDNAGRLIYEEFDHYDDEYDQTSEWLYDLVGNRLMQTINGRDTLYDYDANDRLLTEIAGEKKTVYGYDHTQQTSKIITEDGEIVSTTTYEYDVQGRMSVVTITTGNRTEITKYQYGADGIRVSAEHESYVDGELQSKSRTEYLNDPKSLTGYSQVLRQTEYDAEGNVIKTISYVIGHQRISQTIEINGEKTTHYFTFDGHGSTRVLLDLAGAVIQLYSFDAYGNALGFNTSEALTEFLYSGEQFDSKIGQQYLRQRYYDPTTGRFNRLDPFFGNITDPQSLHKYLYAHADPMSNFDPSGESVLSVVYQYLAKILMFSKNITFGVFLPFTVLNAATEIVNHGYKLFSTGNGGKDATAILLRLRDNIIGKWNSMSSSEKNNVISELWSRGLVSWDIKELVFSSKTKWTDGIADPLEETLTYFNEVYSVAEVNYLLWGMINKLAWDDNIYTYLTNYLSTSLIAYSYRVVMGGITVANSWLSTGYDIALFYMFNNTTISIPPLYETITGRMAWIYYGWQWVVDPSAPLPSHESLWRATPTSEPWQDELSWEVANIGGNVR